MTTWTFILVFVSFTGSVEFESIDGLREETCRTAAAIIERAEFKRGTAQAICVPG